jgi:RNA polymerase sigma factor (sigma-70 family)
MGTHHRRSDPEHPPRHGPFAVTWWDDRACRWAVRLRPEASRLIGDYLVRYPRPAAVVHRRWPHIVHRARARGLTEDDLHELALYGVTRAALTFDPTAGASFATYAGNAARDAIRNELRPRAGEPLHFVRPDQVEHGSPWTGWDAVGRNADDRPDRDEHTADRLERVRRFIHRLPDRDRDLVGRYYGLDGGEPATLAAVGAGFGVSAERARQLLGRVLARARTQLADA